MKSLSMMIVDDDASARDLLGSILRTQFGAEVTAANDGTEAMRKCREQSFSIVWLDIDMPGNDGFDVLKVIKSVNPDQFIAMVSAHSSLDYVKKSVEMGAKGFIVKPFSTAKVKNIIDKFSAG